MGLAAAGHRAECCRGVERGFFDKCNSTNVLEPLLHGKDPFAAGDVPKEVSGLGLPLHEEELGR